MARTDLSRLIHREIKFLIITGVCVMMMWSATNHYLGSYQGGRAWITSSQSTLEKLVLQQQQTLQQLSDIFLDSQPTLHQEQVYYRLHHPNSSSPQTPESFGEHSTTLWSRVQEWLVDHRDTLKDQTSFDGFIDIKGNIFHVNISSNSRSLGLLITPLNQRWLNHLRDLTATELLLQYSSSTDSLTSFACFNGACAPSIKDELHNTIDVGSSLQKMILKFK